MRLQVWSDRVVRVTFGLGQSLPPLKSLAVISKPEHVNWKLAPTADAITLSTKSLAARVDRQTGTAQFFDASNHLLLAESPGSRALTPNKVALFDVLASRQSFMLAPGEAIYGLGQHQKGLMNYRGHRVQLLQENREIGIPMLVSSRGYGMLWDNPAVTDVDAGMTGHRGFADVDFRGGGRGGLLFHGRAGIGRCDRVLPRADGRGADDGRMGVGASGSAGNVTPASRNCSMWCGATANMNVPLDGIIQDWQYWTTGAVGFARV